MRKIKRFKKYTYSMVKICNETDQVYTRCYVCGEWKPSTVEYFKKEGDKNKERGIRPICKCCVNEQLKEWKETDKKRKEMENMIEVSQDTIQAKPLINEKKDEKSSMEEKLDKLLTYLFG